MAWSQVPSYAECVKMNALLQVRQQLQDILTQQKIKLTTAGHEWDIVRKAICSAYFQNAAKFKSIGEYVNCR